MRKNKNFKFRYLKYGFTLAEVLITLVIIGVVAAITIPSLIVKLDKVVKENQIKVFESKLQKGMDRMNLAGEIGPYYQTTEDFIKALSAHMKIVTICKAGELQNCFPYESIQVQGLDEPVKVKEIDSGKSFGLNDAGYKDVAGMVLADGTPMLLTWKTDCEVSDPDSSTRGGSKFGDNAGISTTSCIKGIYDINGTRGPNLMLKDVLGYGGVVTLKGGGIKIAGMKISKALTAGSWQPMLKSEICDDTAQEKNITYTFKDRDLETSRTEILANTPQALSLGIKYCYYTSDYWAGAARECGGVKYLPTMQQIADLANELYAKNGIFDAGIGAYDNGNAYATYENNRDYPSEYTYQSILKLDNSLLTWDLSLIVIYSYLPFYQEKN